MAGDMRVQLQALLDDKEKQLNLAGTLGQRILAQQLELEERINQLVDAEERLQISPEEADSEMRNKLQELADVMQGWETENERMFSSFGTKLNGGGGGMPPSPEMPSMSEFGTRTDEGSTSMRSNGPSAAQSSRRAKNAAHRANDVEFAFEIGSSLLVEVRRLQALLAERDKLIQDMKEEKDDLEKAVEALRMSLREQEGTTDKFKEENWNLEVQLQEVRNSLNNAQASTSRLEGEQKRMAKQLSSARETSDGYKTEVGRLSDLLEELRAKHETDIAQMRKNNAGLQRDKSDLQASLDALKADMAKRERASIRFGSPATPSMVSRSAVDEDDIFSTGGASSRRHLDASAIYSQGPGGDSLHAELDESPPASPSRSTHVGPSHPSNELESTKQSLSHAQRQISTLKSAVQREKELNRDMKKRLADHLRNTAEGEWDDEDPEESTDVILDEPGQQSLPRLTPARFRGRGRGRGAAPRPVGGSRVTSLTQRFSSASGGNRRSSLALSEGEESVVTVGDESEVVPQEDLTSPFVDSSRASMDGMDPEFANVLRNVRTRKGSIDSLGIRKNDQSFTAGSQSSRGSGRRGRGSGRRVVSRPTSIIGALAGELGGEGFSITEDPVSTSASLQADLGLVSPATSPSRSVFRLGQVAVPEVEEVEVEVREIDTQTDPVAPEVKEVEVIREVKVPVEIIREVEVVKQVPVEIIKEVIKEVQVPVEVIKEVQVEVVREVPVEVIREVIKEVPVEVVKEVIKEVIKEVPVEVIREVEVVKEVEVVRETPVDVVKEVQVERVKEVPVEVIKEVEVVREVPKEVIREVPVEVIREVQVIKEVEVIKEVPTIVYQEKEVPKIVYQDREVVVYKDREPEPKPETAELAIQTEPEPEPVTPSPSTSESSTQTQLATSEMGVSASAGSADASVQTQAVITTNTQAQAEDELSTPVATAPVPLVNGAATLATPPRNTHTGAFDDITPTPNILRAGAQLGLVPVQTRDSFLQANVPFVRPHDEDARTITETPTEGEWEDARESLTTPSGQTDFHSMASTINIGFQSDDDEPSIRAGRVGVYGHRWSLQPQPQEREFDSKSIDAAQPSTPIHKPEVREMSIQTDAPAPPTPSGTGVGFTRIGTPSQFKYIPSPTSTPSEVAMGKRPATAPREGSDIFARSRIDRRPSIDSDASSMRSMSSPKPRPSISSVGPIVQVDRTRPPTMMLPPPPPMPPPPMPPMPSQPVRRTTSNIAPPRPTSPPPPELLQRATTPTFGAGSSLLVPQRTIGRQQGANMSPAGGLRQPLSTSSFRSTPNNARPTATGAALPSMASGSSRRMSVSSDRSSEQQHARFAAADSSRPQAGETTDPTIIHAITQTMIGEFLFKYTRKVVGKGHGEKRHKRFFWIHPYTKTLYWSDADPGSSGVSESSAKSAYIDSVKSILDPNPVPPGIHQYSIIVSTPQREMKFTAPTKERHDIWFSALNYLLARPSTVALSPESANRSRFGTMTPGGSSGPADEIRQQIMSSPRSARTTGSNTYHEGWNTTPKAFRSQSQISTAGSVGKRAGTPAAEYMRWNPPEAQSPTKSTRAYQQQSADDSMDFENVEYDEHDDGFVPTEPEPGFEGLENVLTPEKTYPCNPLTTRGSSTKLSSSGDKIVYTNGRTVVIRDLNTAAFGITYSQHVQPATVARISPSGYYCASADSGGNVRVWDIAGTDQVLKSEKKAISGKINDLAWDADSQRIIAVGDGKEKSVHQDDAYQKLLISLANRFGVAFNADSGNSVGEITGHSKVLNATSIRHKRPFRAVTAGDDNKIVFYTGVPFKYQSSITTHTRFVQDVQFSPSGDVFASVGSDMKAFLYNGETGETLAELAGAHKGSIMACAWSPDSTNLLTSSMDRTVKLWDVETRQAITTWTLGSAVEHQQVGNTWTGDNLVSLSLNGTLNIFDKRDGSKPTRTLYARSNDGRVISFTTAEGARPISGEAHKSQVVALAYSGDQVYSTAFDDSIRSINIAENKFSATSNPTNGQPKDIAASGPTIYVATVNGVQVLENEKEKYKLPVNNPVTAIAVHGKTVAAGSEDKSTTLYEWDGNGLKELGKLTSNKGTITAIAFSPNGSLVAAADSAGKIFVYDVAKKEAIISSWVFHSARVYSLAWTADGKYCASGSLDTHIYIYSIDSPNKNISVKNAHANGVTGVAWVGEGLLASSGADGCVRTWKITLPS
ncbi:unnamed protein product [Rhizoctonia solani]|uniref:PH domain-containing protein n=1 Tax=Rhizoctonia solani TaxID=456999 RepID=A0A8H3B8E3_9AGAM|nr:unnamed protein product [Rhizoctonia solani]